MGKRLYNREGDVSRTGIVIATIQVLSALAALVLVALQGAELWGAGPTRRSD
jgi:hypothetical protein